MHSFTRTEKIFATILIAGGMLWLGGSILRIALAFDLFIPGTLTFTAIAPELQAHSLRLFSMLGFYTIFGYALTFIGALTLFISQRRRWREQGWILAAGMLFFLFTPIEGWQLYYDLHLIDIATPQLPMDRLAEARTLLLGRLSAGQGLPLLAVLGYYTAVVFCIWRPLSSPLAQAEIQSDEQATS